jgi:hypothetical protein
MADRQEMHIGVTIAAEGRDATWHAAAWLTLPGELRRSELQVLVPGAGYDHRYWDWPLEPVLLCGVGRRARHRHPGHRPDRVRREF